MAVCNVPAMTRIDLYGVWTPSWNGAAVVTRRPLRAWSHFDIKEIVRNTPGRPGSNDTNTVWCKSGAGHWYPFSQDAFAYRTPSGGGWHGDRIYISPAGPASIAGAPVSNQVGTAVPQGSKPKPGTLYIPVFGGYTFISHTLAPTV